MRMHPSRMRRSAIAVALVAALLAAGSSGFSQVRHHAAHAHGTSTMNVVIDGPIVTIELEGPMANFAGFERTPSNDDEVRLLADVRARLEQPGGFLYFDTPAVCELRSAAVTVPTAGGDSDHSRHDHDHDDDTHLEISGSYEFACGQLDRLSTLSVRIFEQFPATEEIEVNLLGESFVTRAELTPESSVLRLRQ